MRGWWVGFGERVSRTNERFQLEHFLVVLTILLCKHFIVLLLDVLQVRLTDATMVRQTRGARPKTSTHRRGKHKTVPFHTFKSACALRCVATLCLN